MTVLNPDHAAEIVKAAVMTGFFYLKDHGLDPKLINQAFAASKSFFELPLKDKSRNALNEL